MLVAPPPSPALLPSAVQLLGPARPLGGWGCRVGVRRGESPGPGPRTAESQVGDLMNGTLELLEVPMSNLSPLEGEPPEADEESPSDDQGLVIHHPAEEQAYRCLLCGQTFPQQSSLVRHHKAHTGMNGAGRALYVCPECGKAFSIQHNLSVHQRIHTGERPFSCPECGRRFSLKQNLLTHRRIHSGKKPYQCAQCRRCFREARFLLNHQRTHARMSPTPPQCSEVSEQQ